MYMANQRMKVYFIDFFFHSKFIVVAIDVLCDY
jgi:hypothetical protein